MPASEMVRGGGATRERALHPSGEDGCKPQVPGAPPGGSVRAGPHRPLTSNRWGPAQLLTVLLSERRRDDPRAPEVGMRHHLCFRSSRQVMKPRRIAIDTACARLLASSFASRFRMWDFTVSSLTWRRRPISRLAKPSATS